MMEMQKLGFSVSESSPKQCREMVVIVWWHSSSESSSSISVKCFQKTFEIQIEIEMVSHLDLSILFNTGSSPSILGGPCLQACPHANFRFNYCGVLCVVQILKIYRSIKFKKMKKDNYLWSIKFVIYFLIKDYNWKYLTIYTKGGILDWDFKKLF